MLDSWAKERVGEAACLPTARWHLARSASGGRTAELNLATQTRSRWASAGYEAHETTAPTPILQFHLQSVLGVRLQYSGSSRHRRSVGEYCCPGLGAPMTAGVLRIAYDQALVPEGGVHVYCGVSELAKSTNKDAAGHAFHHRCLLQAGLIGTLLPQLCFAAFEYVYMVCVDFLAHVWLKRCGA